MHHGSAVLHKLNYACTKQAKTTVCNYMHFLIALKPLKFWDIMSWFHRGRGGGKLPPKFGTVV